MNTLIWIGIFFCISQSAMFSGLNLAFFSISKLKLEIESQRNNKDALKIAAMREDSNFLLTTILWGNVGINVLLTLLLYPVAKPSALVLDKWLGGEAIQYFLEKDLRELLKMHIDAPETEITKMEGKGAINKDVILLWGDQKRIITGSDLLGRLLRGIVKTKQAGEGACI